MKDAIADAGKTILESGDRGKAVEKALAGMNLDAPDKALSLARALINDDAYLAIEADLGASATQRQAIALGQLTEYVMDKGSAAQLSARDMDAVMNALDIPDNMRKAARPAPNPESGRRY